MSTRVGSQSRAANSWLTTVPGLMWPGQAHDQRGAVATLPSFAFLAFERSDAAVGEAN
jgi:hypothetical protein